MNTKAASSRRSFLAVSAGALALGGISPPAARADAIPRVSAAPGEYIELARAMAKHEAIRARRYRALVLADRLTDRVYGGDESAQARLERIDDRFCSPLAAESDKSWLEELCPLFAEVEAPGIVYEGRLYLNPCYDTHEDGACPQGDNLDIGLVLVLDGNGHGRIGLG